MNPSLKRILPLIEQWPPEDQEALAEFAHEIEARRGGIYEMTAEEAAAVAEGSAQAERGEFVSEERMAAVWRRFAAV
jgi:predicted transcriptional regulator